MQRPAISAVLLLALTACDSETDPPKAGIPTQKEIAQEVTSSVSDVLADKGPKWKVDYSGDLSGSVEGGILTATAAGSGSMTSALGKAMKSDFKGSAPQAFQVNFMASQTEERFANVNLTLADGTKCKSDMKKLSMGKVTNPDPKTFTAEVSGELLCGESKDKRISYSASLAK